MQKTLEENAPAYTVYYTFKSLPGALTGVRNLAKGIKVL